MSKPDVIVRLGVNQADFDRSLKRADQSLERSAKRQAREQIKQMKAIEAAAAKHQKRLTEIRQQEERQAQQRQQARNAREATFERNAVQRKKHRARLDSQHATKRAAQFRMMRTAGTGAFIAIAGGVALLNKALQKRPKTTKQSNSTSSGSR